jgi:transposase-like protein
VEKHEKPVSQTTADSGINENMLRWRVQSARKAAETGLKPFPGHGRPRDEYLIRLRKEVRALRTANAILKKAYVRRHRHLRASSPPVTAYRFIQANRGTYTVREMTRLLGVKCWRLLPVGPVRALKAAAGNGCRVGTPRPGDSRTATPPVGSPRLRTEWRLMDGKRVSLKTVARLTAGKQSQRPPGVLLHADIQLTPRPFSLRKPAELRVFRLPLRTPAGIRQHVAPLGCGLCIPDCGDGLV